MSIVRPPRRHHSVCYNLKCGRKGVGVVDRCLLGLPLRRSDVFEGDHMEIAAVARAEPDRSTGERYESLIRIANAIRAQKEPQELFGILVHELSQVIQFDGIAQFDESSHKINWHL